MESKNQRPVVVPVQGLRKGRDRLGRFFESLARLFGFPLIRRELIALLRTRRAFWLLATIVCLSGLLPILNWPGTGSNISGIAWTPRLLGLFFLSQLTVALFIIPAFTAGAISGERERGTYDLLYSTLLSPFAIVFSKVLASVGYLILLLAASTPAVCVLYLLGGVEFGAIGKCYLVTLASILLSVLVCLTESLRALRTAQAVLRGILWVVFWNIGLCLLLYLASGLSYFPFGLSPFAAIMAEMEGLASSAWAIHVAFTQIISFFYLVYLLSHVQTPAPSRGSGLQKPLIRPLHRRTWLTAAIINEAKNPISVITNTIFLKEIHSEFFGRPLFRRLVFWSTLALTALVLHTQRMASVEDRAGLVCGVSICLTALLVPGVAASTFPREIEQGNFDFLRGTLLSLREVLSGKFFASLYACAGIVAAAFCAMALAATFYGSDRGSQFHENSGAWVFFASGSVLLVNYIWTVAVATLASVLSRRTVGALVLSYLGALAPLALWPLILVSVLSRQPEWFLVITHPGLALAGAVGELPSEGRQGLILGGYVLFYGALTCVLWLLSRWHLESFRARDV